MDGGARPGEQVELFERAPVRPQPALAERDSEACDGEDDQERHLEAGLKERARREDQHRQRRRAQRVEGVGVAVQPARQQIDRDHDERALRRQAKASEQRVAGRDGDGQQDGSALRQPNAAQQPEECGCDQRDMQTGDDEEMEGPGALEALAQGVLRPLRSPKSMALSMAASSLLRRSEAGSRAFAGESTSSVGARTPALRREEPAAPARRR